MIRMVIKSRVEPAGSKREFRYRICGLNAYNSFTTLNPFAIVPNNFFAFPAVASIAAVDHRLARIPQVVEPFYFVV